MRRTPVPPSCLVLTFAAAVLSCAPAAPQRFPARPPGCPLETFKTLPERPFLELETFNLHSLESVQEVLDAVRERACRDGADAIYAPKNGRMYTYAIALKWQDAPPPAR